MSSINFQSVISRADTLFELWNKYEPRLPPLYYQEKLLEIGDFLVTNKVNHQYCYYHLTSLIDYFLKDIFKIANSKVSCCIDTFKEIYLLLFFITVQSNSFLFAGIQSGPMAVLWTISTNIWWSECRGDHRCGHVQNYIFSRWI